MKKVAGFYRMFLQTLNPKNYWGFAESTAKNTHKYYFHLIFNAFVIFALIMIPAIINLPNTLQSKLDTVDKFNVNVEFSTKSPVAFPQKNPILLINYAPEPPKQTANIILHNNVFFIGGLLKNIEYNISGFGNVKAHKAELSKFITAIIILMLPTVAILFWLFILIKYYLIALAAALVVFLVTNTFRRRTVFRKVYNSAIYGLSLSVFLDLVFFAFSFEFFYIQFLPLLIYTICGAVSTWEKLVPVEKHKFVELK